MTRKVERIHQGENDNLLFIGLNRLIINESGKTRPLTSDDLTLYVEYHPGDTVENDTTCDSQFILNIIEDIGFSIH
jgi:hypothetical protein